MSPPKIIPSDPAIKVRSWPAGEQIDLLNLDRPVREGLPIEFHIKADGALDNSPSLCIVIDLKVATMPYIITQVSSRMLEPIIAEIRRLKERSL